MLEGHLSSRRQQSNRTGTTVGGEDSRLPREPQKFPQKYLRLALEYEAPVVTVLSTTSSIKDTNASSDSTALRGGRVSGRSHTDIPGM